MSGRETYPRDSSRWIWVMDQPATGLGADDSFVLQSCDKVLMTRLGGRGRARTISQPSASQSHPGARAARKPGPQPEPAGQLVLWSLENSRFGISSHLIPHFVRTMGGCHPSSYAFMICVLSQLGTNRSTAFPDPGSRAKLGAVSWEPVRAGKRGDAKDTAAKQIRK